MEPPKSRAYYPYGLIGNCVSAALVSDQGSVDWMCMPYLDSPSVFAKVLDAQKGGSFRVEGIDTVSIRQEYVRFTPILRTRVETRDGVFDIYDFMPRFMTGAQEYYCPAEIHRSVRLVAGRPKVRVVLDPRPNYGASGCRIEDHGEFLKFVTDLGEYHSYYFYTNAAYAAVRESQPFELTQSLYLVLSYHQKVAAFDADRAYVEFERTKSYWLGWTGRSTYPERYRDPIIRSLITLKLMMYQRTGAVVAAPTTSLPEIAGGERNWDYRYCWIRDASMIVELFARLGHLGSATRYMNFILDRMLLKNDGISVMYGIHGEKVLPEKLLTHLEGCRGSQPVRVGNAAHLQTQNDVYGELIDAIYTFFQMRGKGGFHLDQELWTAVRSLVNGSKANWEKPDNGIWEYRGRAQHHVFSKLMNWVAMDRAGRIARRIGKAAYAQDCFETARRIRQDILEKGWNDRAGAFTMAYGSEDADASVLLMLHYGFLPKDDPRMIQTVDFCFRKLVRNGVVMRYTAADDFGVPENAFLICTFWMVNALYLTGRVDEARQMFARALATANPLGLMAEGVEPATAAQTGNFPQGYSHLALVQTAMLLETDYQWDSLRADA